MDVVEHDELSRTEALFARLLLGPHHEWNPDVAMRYLPIVEIIGAHGLADEVTEVGSGSVGIAPYLERPFTGLDTDLGRSTHPLMTPISASVLDTGFPSASRPCVVSTDMLEHVPVELRQGAVDELVRITGKLLILAVPSGADAEAHDREMAERFREHRGAEHRFLLEHVEHGLPTREQLRGYVEQALVQCGRTGHVTMQPNANLDVRSAVMRHWIDRRASDKVAWVWMTWRARSLARQNDEPAYRQIVVVELAS
jgi:hypothetical protein